MKMVVEKIKTFLKWFVSLDRLQHSKHPENYASGFLNGLKPITYVFGSFIFLIPLCFVLILLLSGCKDELVEPVRYHHWEPDVRRHAYPATLKFLPQESKLSHANRQNILDLVKKANLDTPLYTRIMMNVPENHGQKSIHQYRQRQIRYNLNELGIENHRIEVSFASPSEFARLSPAQRNHIIVSVDQYEVIIPDCPGWQTMGIEKNTQTEQNFGCATASNMASMIAEPRDFYKPLPKAKGDAVYNTNIVQPYRDGVTKKLNSAAESSNETSQSISGISAFIE